MTRAEHDSLEVFLKASLTDEQRENVLFVSFTQWGFALAALADTATCLHGMGSEVTLGFWANKTPMHDTGWSVNDKVAKLFASPARDQRVRDALIDFGIPKSSLAQPPVKGWQPAQRVPIGERLANFCSSHYGGRINREVIDKMLSLHRAPSARWRGVRTSVVRAAVLLGRIRPAVARLRPARLRGQL